MHVLGALAEKKYHMYIPKVNMPLPSTQFDPRAFALLHVTRSTYAMLSFCVLVLLYTVWGMVYCVLETCLSVNEQPVGGFLMSIQALSSDKH